MAAKTRADLVAAIARRFGEYLRSTATGGSTTAITDSAALTAPDEYWTNHYAYIVTDAGGQSAAPEAEERPVTAHSQGDTELTVSPAFSAAVASGDTYEILPTRRANITEAINAAIRAMGETWLVFKVDDSTVVLADDDFDYNLPTDLVRLLAVMVRDDSDEPWQVLDGRLWTWSKTPGAQELLLETELDDDYTVRLEYLARIEEMDADSDTLGLGEPAEREAVDFIEHYALYWLHSQATARAGTGAEFRPHLTLAQYHAERAEAIRKAAAPFFTRGTVRGKRWARSRA